MPRRPRQEVIPWSEVKSKAGAKKQFDTTGYACMNPDCVYYGVSDSAIHALVSDGPRGIRNDIPYLKCQACGKKQTSRLHTPMENLKTPVERDV